MSTLADRMQAPAEAFEIRDATAEEIAAAEKEIVLWDESVKAFYNTIHEKSTGRFGTKVLDGGLPTGADGIMVNKAMEFGLRNAEANPTIGGEMREQMNRDVHFEEAKAATTYRLDAKLKDDPDWNALVTEMHNDPDIMSPRDGMEHLTPSQLVASKLVGSWAGSSSDENPLSLEMQVAATREFKLTGTSPFVAAAAKKHPYYTIDENNHMQTLSPKAQMGMQKFTRAQYNLTQETLSTYGIKEVTVFRGIHDVDIAPGRSFQEYTLNPLSSFSTSYITAGHFATTKPESTSAILGMTIPIKRIMSMPGSGAGCREESEVVVLGGKVRAYTEAWKHGSVKMMPGPVAGVITPVVSGGKGGLAQSQNEFNVNWIEAAR